MRKNCGQLAVGLAAWIAGAGGAAAVPPGPAWATTPSGLNLRSGPGTGYGVVDICPNLGFLGLRGAAASGFLPVAHNTLSGWSSAPYVTTGRMTPGAWARVLNASATIRTSPTASAPISSVPGMNSAVNLLASDAASGWWKVQRGTVTGWMAPWNLSPCSTAGTAKLYAWPGRGRLLSLQEFSPAMVEYIKGRAGTTAVSLFDAGSGLTYHWNGDVQIRSASIIKVPVMMAVMDRAARAGRNLTAWEQARIEPMIRWSSNADTTELYNSIGGMPALLSYLGSIGVTNCKADPASPSAWGYTLVTANDMTEMLGKLHYRQTLRDDLVNYGLHQMTRLIEEHRDGVFYSAGGRKNWYAVKGGYYPEYGNGIVRVHSIGIVDLVDDAYDPALGLGGTRTYILSILTKYPLGYGDLYYGVDTTNEVAKLAYRAVLARR